MLVGSAYNTGGNQELLYRESYTDMNERGEVLVEYARPDGTAIARKTLYYGDNFSKPGFEMLDLRDNQRLGAFWRGEQLVLVRSGRTALREKPIKPMPPVVVDAGFAHFIQSQWDKLIAGERVRFNFAFPNRLTSVLLVAEEVAGESTPIYREGEAWRYFRIEVANRLMALFADTMYLAYAEQDKKLMVYQGRSNISSDDGGNWNVKIVYEYR
jgi:hypothetical protein